MTGVDCTYTDPTYYTPHSRIDHRQSKPFSGFKGIVEIFTVCNPACGSTSQRCELHCEEEEGCWFGGCKPAYYWQHGTAVHCVVVSFIASII